MELHPILEKDTCPNPKLWYVLSCVGDSPTARVGHTCTFIPGPENSDGKVYVIGGANPSGSFSDVYVLDLATFSWDTVDAPGFKARYEHAAFVPKSQPNKIYIFGGADQSGNQNDLQVLDTVSKTWSTLRPTGAAPSPRTYHTTACAGDRFVVYSGGHQGSDPVGDRQVHSFDAVTCTWSTLTVRGDSPKPRHGHITQAVGSKIYVHGGMAGPTFYDDLHVLDPDSLTWRSVKQKRGRPAARAAHGSCVHGSCLLIFGGMNREGALDDAWSLNTSEYNIRDNARPFSQTLRRPPTSSDVSWLASAMETVHNAIHLCALFDAGVGVTCASDVVDNLPDEHGLKNNSSQENARHPFSH